MVLSSVKRARSRIAATGIAVVLGIGTVLVTPVAVAADPIASSSIELIADGTAQGTANGCLVTDPDASLADETANDGIVCTDDTVTWGWNYSVPPTGASDVTFTQTVPAGWNWTSLSVTSCEGGVDFTGTATISPDGRTLTCVLQFPDTGAARAGQLPVFAVPQPGIPDGTSYTAELTVTQAELPSAQTSTADPVVVRAQPRWNLSKNLAAVLYNRQADFGFGLESAVALSYIVRISATSGNNFKGQEGLEAGTSFIDDVSGIDPEALLDVCNAFVAVCDQPGGKGQPITVSFPPGIVVPETTADNNWSTPAIVAMYITVVVPERSLPIYPAVYPTTNQLTGFDPDGTSGVSNLGPGVETGSEPNATCYPTNDNCAEVPLTRRPPGLQASATKSLRQYTDVPNNCQNTWWWCEPLEGVTGTSAFNDSSTGNLDGVAYRGDTYFAGFRMGWNTNLDIPANAMICDKWDPALQQIDPSGFSSKPVVNWQTEASWQYTNRVYADDTEREQAGCGAMGDNVTDGPWFSTIAAAGGPAAVTGARQAVPTSPLFGTHSAALPMRVGQSGPTGGIVPDFLGIYYDQAVGVNGDADGWIFAARDSYRVNEMRLSIDKNTVPAGTTGAVAGARVPFTLDVSATVVNGGAARPVTSLAVVDELDPCYSGVVLDPSVTQWQVTVTPGDFGADALACTPDDVSGDILTFTPTVPIATGDPIQLITYSVLVSVLVDNGQAILNTAVVSADGTLQSASARTDDWTITVAAPGAVRVSKVADQSVVEITPDGISWTVTYANTLGTDLGETVFIDVLPHNGDGRGSNFSGQFGFAGAEVLSGADTTLFYTTDAVAGIDVDPATNASTWQASTVFAGDLADVTAIKIVASDLVRGEAGQVRIHANPVGNVEGDRYDNSVSAGRAVGLAQPVPATLISEIRVVASTVGDRVWFDVNRDGQQDAGEAGFAGITVRLLDAQGATIAVTTTIADGIYSFGNLHSGTYRVRLDASTLPFGYLATYDLDDLTVAPNGDSGQFSVGVDVDRVDVDFGYTTVVPVTPPIMLGQTGIAAAPTLMAGGALFLLGLALVSGELRRRRKGAST